MFHDKRLRLYRSVVLGGLAALVLAVPVAARAAGKTSAWATETNGSSASEGSSANPMCIAIEGTLKRHIATMRALRRDIDKASHAPPPTVYAAIQGILGNAAPNAKVVEQTRKLANERKTAEGLNAKLTAAKCAAVDIDFALASGPGNATAAPEVPKAEPDLLPLPQDATAR
ncbi:MAG: hypothetical protein ABL897_01725 [Hyphomicrobium sp.]